MGEKERKERIHLSITKTRGNPFDSFYAYNNNNFCCGFQGGWRQGNFIKKSSFQSICCDGYLHYALYLHFFMTMSKGEKFLELGLGLYFDHGWDGSNGNRFRNWLVCCFTAFLWPFISHLHPLLLLFPLLCCWILSILERYDFGHGSQNNLFAEEKERIASLFFLRSVWQAED